MYSAKLQPIVYIMIMIRPGSYKHTKSLHFSQAIIVQGILRLIVPILANCFSLNTLLQKNYYFAVYL